jgi:hypothetical protein
MLISVLEWPESVPGALLARFVARVLGAIGPSLPLRQQEELFATLNSLSPGEIALPISVRKVEIRRPQYDIVPHESATGGRKEVFLYSYLKDKRLGGQKRAISVPLKQTVTVTAELYNPFGLALKPETAKLIVNNPAVVCKPAAEYLKPKCVTTVHYHMVPNEIVAFAVLGFELSFAGAKQKLLIQDELEVEVVDNVPRYHLRTDLPLSSELALYDGEIHEFRFWITNSGDSPITELGVRFHQPEMARVLEEPKLPLLPGAQLSIRCSLTADKSDDIVGMSILSSCEGSQFSCSQNIRQPLAISDSLSVRRIFPMKTVPPQTNDEDGDAWAASQIDQIYVGYEVENLSDTTFQYDATVSNSRVTGLIGKHESILMVAGYATRGLKSDGSDAQKSRIIAMTKTMEETVGHGLSGEQRLKVAKCVSIMQKLEEKWNFDWAVSSTRKGKLVRRAAMIDDDLYDAIESRQVRATTYWQLGETRVDSVKTNQIYDLVADFDGDEIVECELQFVGEIERNREILWEGELLKRVPEGQAKFAFVLCFNGVGRFKLLIKHSAKSGITGQTPLLVKVVED